jgi:hypothetical protein
MSPAGSRKRRDLRGVGANRQNDRVAVSTRRFASSYSTRHRLTDVIGRHRIFATLREALAMIGGMRRDSADARR